MNMPIALVSVFMWLVMARCMQHPALSLLTGCSGSARENGLVLGSGAVFPETGLVSATTLFMMVSVAGKELVLVLQNTALFMVLFIMQMVPTVLEIPVSRRLSGTTAGRMCMLMFPGAPWVTFSSPTAQFSLRVMVTLLVVTA